MSKILRCLAGLFILCFIGNAFAAGYNCPTYRKYTSCNSGYYISECDGNAYRDGELMQSYDLMAGNSCKSCPSGYSCRGGLYCPDKSSVTCSAGYYLKANATSCSACGGNNYYCPGGTFNVSSSAQGRNTVSSGYYSTGGTSTTRTGQSQCTGATYCTNGVKYNCPSGYDDNTRNGKTSSTQCQINCSAGYYLASRTDPACTAVGIGYYKAAHTVSFGSSSTRTACPTSYTTASTTSGTSINRCYLSVSAGYVRNGTTGTTLTRCAAGTYRPAHNAYYGTSYACRACSGRTKYSAAGAGSCSTVSTGYYTTGCNTSGNNCTGQSRCSGATYCTSGIQYDCPTATSGWTQGTGTGWSGYGQCFEYRNATSISSYCASGQLRRYASSATAWAPTASEYTAFRAEPGAYVSGSGINMTCTQCSGPVYSAGGDVTSCTACPTTLPVEWRSGSGTGWDSYTDCYVYRNATSISSYCASGQLRRYASSASAWSGTATEYTAFRADPGAYVSGSGINMTCAECNAGSYSAGGDVHACTACPALTDGFEYADGTYTKDTYKSCVQSTTDPSAANPNCMADDTAANVGIIQIAGSPTGWNGSVLAVGIAAKPGAILDSRFQDGALGIEGAYDFDNMCTQCGAGTYSAGGDATECTACPALTPGFVYNTTKGMESYTECVQGTKDPSAVNPYCVATSQNTAIWQQADSPTTWNAVTLAQYIGAAPGAILGSDFNEYGVMVVENSAYDFDNMCIPCTGNTYSAGGMVKSCTSCNSDYTISGTALTNHDSASDCKITCSGGEYVPTAGDGCVNVGVGYWGAGGTVSQTSTLGRNECESGLTTIGSGLGADEAGDCGRVLNVGDEKIYLRSTKKTTPSLNISINGDVFYGNMSTATKGSLRINSGGTTYSVYDDSM